MRHAHRKSLRGRVPYAVAAKRWGSGLTSLLTAPPITIPLRGVLAAFAFASVERKNRIGQCSEGSLRPAGE